MQWKRYVMCQASFKSRKQGDIDWHSAAVCVRADRWASTFALPQTSPNLFADSRRAINKKRGATRRIPPRSTSTHATRSSSTCATTSGYVALAAAFKNSVGGWPQNTRLVIRQLAASLYLVVILRRCLKTGCGSTGYDQGSGHSGVFSLARSVLLAIAEWKYLQKQMQRLLIKIWGSVVLACCLSLNWINTVDRPLFAVAGKRCWLRTRRHSLLPLPEHDFFLCEKLVLKGQPNMWYSI